MTLKRFRTCHPKMCRSDVLIIASQRHSRISTRRRGPPVSPSVPRSRPSDSPQERPSAHQEETTFSSPETERKQHNGLRADLLNNPSLPFLSCIYRRVTEPQFTAPAQAPLFHYVPIIYHFLFVKLCKLFSLTAPLGLRFPYKDSSHTFKKVT